MCTIASPPHSSEDNRGSVDNSMIRSNSLKSDIGQNCSGGVKQNHGPTSYSSLLQHKPRRANSIAAIRPLWVHAEQGLEMKPFEPCANLSQGRSLGNAQMPTYYSMSSLNIRAGLIGCNKCHLPRQNSEYMLSKQTLSADTVSKNITRKYQDTNTHVISQFSYVPLPSWLIWDERTVHR